MTIIAQSSTTGFRPCMFRNQPVHNFYGHLQAVLKAIKPDSGFTNLFTRPVSNPGTPDLIDWTTELKGQAKAFTELEKPAQKAIAEKLTQYLKLIEEYSSDRQNKDGLEKDYADYLASVAIAPDMKQIYSINDEPVLIHWGFINESDADLSLSNQSSWQAFILEIQRQSAKDFFNDTDTTSQTGDQASLSEANATEAVVSNTPATTEDAKVSSVSNAKPSQTKLQAPPDDINDESPIVACGLGKYVWVKFLAILLAIIILLLLLFKLLPNPIKDSGSSGVPGIAGGLEGLLGGSDGAGGPGGSGGSGGMPAAPPAGQNGSGEDICPHCGSEQVVVEENQSGSNAAAPKAPVDSEPTEQQ